MFTIFCCCSFEIWEAPQQLLWVAWLDLIGNDKEDRLREYSSERKNKRVLEELLAAAVLPGLETCLTKNLICKDDNQFWRPFYGLRCKIVSSTSLKDFLELLQAFTTLALLMLGLLYEVLGRHRLDGGSGRENLRPKMTLRRKNAISRIAAFLDHKIQSQKNLMNFLWKLVDYKWLILWSVCAAPRITYRLDFGRNEAQPSVNEEITLKTSNYMPFSQVC